MEIHLTYEDVEKILQHKFNIEPSLNPYPLWYSDADDEFDTIGQNKMNDVIIKLRVNSDLI